MLHATTPFWTSFQATGGGLGGGSLSLPWSPFHPQVSLLHDTRDQLRGFLLGQNPKLLPSSTSPLQELFQQKAEKSTAGQSWAAPRPVLRTSKFSRVKQGLESERPEGPPQPNSSSPVRHPTESAEVKRELSSSPPDAPPTSVHSCGPAHSSVKDFKQLS